MGRFYQSHSAWPVNQPALRSRWEIRLCAAGSDGGGAMASQLKPAPLASLIAGGGMQPARRLVGQETWTGHPARVAETGRSLARSISACFESAALAKLGSSCRRRFEHEVDHRRIERPSRLPAAPGETTLPLLPLGPDGVRWLPPRRTHSDAPRQDNRGLRPCQRAPCGPREKESASPFRDADWRRGWDSNPRSLSAHALSKRAR
jgi:hypothetical protein